MNNISPKQKAKNIYNEFKNLNLNGMTDEIALNCAFVCVAKIINSLSDEVSDTNTFLSKRKYWKAVKEEILTYKN